MKLCKSILPCNSSYLGRRSGITSISNTRLAEVLPPTLTHRGRDGWCTHLPLLHNYIHSTYAVSGSMSSLLTASEPFPPQRFKYSPFQDARSIRILTLHPSADREAPLRGDLAVQSLSEDELDPVQEPAPPYEAISYVWGDSKRTASLLCNSAILNITQSIHDALVRIRLPDAPRRLWADQVCINQEDVAERSQQVDLMNLVYKNATQVLVWLGPDDEAVAEDAVRMISHLNSVFADEESHAIFRKAHTEDLSKQDPAPWQPLAKLSMLPWV